MEPGLIKLLLLFGLLIGFVVWQYVSVSRDLDRDDKR